MPLGLELARVSPTTASQHPSKLRLAGMVRGRREGTFVYCTVIDGPVPDVLEVALDHTVRQ
ncbi:helix-turn-helix domain-containing protein [Pseudonocardia sp.]|uniref:helix-turn-helix domain-containing protein n=1 Tax=Pseudonocardia sp. TaxID=60912 RepID=UPI003D0E612D